jgi:hypothetical protein
MITVMSPRLTTALIGLVLAAACGSTPPPAPERKNAQGKEPTTAREKQLLEAKAAGELDGSDAKFGKWRYQGERADCFYLLEGRCFKTQKAACAKAKCKAPQTCTGDDGSPVTLACK